MINNGSIIGSDSAQLTLGTVYRVGLRQTSGSGTAVLQAYLATGDAAFGSPFAQSSSQTIANAADEVLLGATFSTAVDMTVDDLALDSGGMPPPSTDAVTRTVVYGYDALTRLSSAVESGSSTNSFSYGYDLAGNRTSVTTNGTTVTSSYDAADQLLGGGVTYDAAGNQTSDGSTTATFDALGRLTQRGGTSFNSTGDGVLVAQTTSGATTRYTQDLAAPLPQILQYLAGGVLTSYPYGVERLGGVNSVTRRWHHADALGSMRRSVDDAGSVTRTQNYDPWGTPQGGSGATSFGFAGELQNASSGVLHLRARWYTTGQGRFASVDPFPGMAEQPYSQHPYQYAYSNPVRWTDPSGRTTAPIGPRGPGERDCLPWELRDPYTGQCLPRSPFPPANNPVPRANQGGSSIDRWRRFAPPEPDKDVGDGVIGPGLEDIRDGMRPDTDDGESGIGVRGIARGFLVLCLSSILSSVIGPAVPPNDPSSTQKDPDPRYVVHYTNKDAYNKIVRGKEMITSGPREGGFESNLFFTETSPCGINGPYNAEWIARVCVGIPSVYTLGAKAAEYYVVIERRLLQGGKWWTDIKGIKTEYNYGFTAKPGLRVPIPIVKDGKTEDLNTGKDIIYPIPIP